MRTPTMALLWELWRHSRFYLASIVLFSSIAGAALLVGLVEPGSPDSRVTFAVLLAAFLAWLSHGWTATVEERQGFVSALGFTRPIRTWVLVTVPMVYVGLTSAAAYLVPMIVLRTAFGVPDLHLQLAALAGVLSMLSAVPYWCTRSRVARFIGSIGLGVVVVHYQLRAQQEGLPPDRWLEMFQVSPAGYAVLGLVAVASMVVTIVGVARQRRGDGWLFLRGGVGERIVLGQPTVLARLVDALRVPCPVSSPTLAQVWLEVRNAGAFVVASGVLAAVAIPLGIALALAFGDGVVTAERRARNVAELSILAAPVVPLIAGMLLIGVRRGRGIAGLTAFDATRAMGSARLIGLRVLVISLSTVLSWLAIGWSIWSFSLERLAGASVRIAVVDFVGTTPVLYLALLALIVAVQLLAMVGYAGAVHAFLRLNAVRLVAGALGLGLYIAALRFAVTMRWLDGAAVALTHVWLAAVAGVAAGLYLYRSALVDRILTPRGSIAVFAAWVSFCAAILFLGPGAERSVAGADPAVFGSLIVFMLVPLVAAALAPWSFNRLRHR